MTATQSSGATGQSLAQAERQALAQKMIGLLTGVFLLCACAASVTHLPAWGEQISVPGVFLAFTLAMIIASQLTVAGAQALWRAFRSDAA